MRLIFNFTLKVKSICPNIWLQPCFDLCFMVKSIISINNILICESFQKEFIVNHVVPSCHPSFSIYGFAPKGKLQYQNLEIELTTHFTLLWNEICQWLKFHSNNNCFHLIGKSILRYTISFFSFAIELYTKVVVLP